MLQNVSIVGVDPNPEMAPYAIEAASRAGLTRDQLQMLDGTAEQLPVASQSQDAVICTLVGIPLHRCSSQCHVELSCVPWNMSNCQFHNQSKVQI